MGQVEPGATMKGYLLNPIVITPLIISALNPPLKITKITNEEGLLKLQDFFARVLAKDGILGFDIETTPIKDFFWRKCRTIQFGNLEEQYVIDLKAFCKDSDELYNSQGYFGKNVTPGIRKVLDVIEPVVCSKDFLKVGVSLGFEYMTFYWNFGLRTFNFYDCAMAEKCIWAGAHSLKDYGFYSMNEMFERYFKQSVDKKYQESFGVDGELQEEQWIYAALDTRLPIAIKMIQEVIASGVKLRDLKAKNSGLVKYLETLEPKIGLEPIVLGDKLKEIIQIENDAIGAFEDMHIYGEHLFREKWLSRVTRKKEEKKLLIEEVLDPVFIPIVGDKRSANTDEEIKNAEETWKSFTIVPDEELELKKAVYAAKKAKGVWSDLKDKRQALETKRKENKEFFKTICSNMKKNRTKINKLSLKCEGNALINYSSNAQLIAAVQNIKGLHGVKTMDDEALEKYEEKGFGVMGAIRTFHGLSKVIGTYGDQWAQEWTTKPCKEEGWLHPGDGRLHCVFNQYNAETGRSSSEKPNAQNLEQDEEVRSCFIADPPNEEIRISTCCDADTTLPIDPFHNIPEYRCSCCGNLCLTKAEEYVLVTADMSGAELRIIAELANDPIWIGAFARGEDVHSVGTEILYEIEWPAGTQPGCKYFELNEKGELKKQKCECKTHKELRNYNKSTNFLLAYGGGPNKLAKEIKKTLEKAVELMERHAQKFPRIWAYLKKSGEDALMLKRSFDMFGRRRLFPEPTFELAKQRVKEDKEEKLRLDEDEADSKVALFKEMTGRIPEDDELWDLTHRQPTDKEIGNMRFRMKGAIERQGKNHAIQGTNATIAKLAMGAGYDTDGKPYLWHTFPLFRAKLLKFVHDELVVQCPRHKAKDVVDLIGDAFKRAAATKMKFVVMEFEANIAAFWKK